MEHPQTQPTVAPPAPPRSRSLLRTKLAIVGATGVLFTGAVFGLGSLAAAEGSGNPDPPTAEAQADSDSAGQVTVDVEIRGDEDGLRYDVELTPDDENLLERFEQCLVDGGLEPFEEDGDSFIDEEDWERVDQVFEDCEPILDELSDGAGVFSNGELGDLGDFDHEELEGFGLPEEDEAVFEEFQQCLDEGDSEDCASILDGLSGHAGIFIAGFEDCEGLEDDDDSKDDHDSEDDAEA